MLRDRPVEAAAQALPPVPAVPSSPSLQRIYEIAQPDSPSPPLGAAGLPGSPLDAPGDHSTEVLHVASISTGALLSPLLEYGPDLVGGTLLVDSSNYTTRVKLHSGPSATSQLSCSALLDSRSPASFVSDSVVERMLDSGALSSRCIRVSPPRNWLGWFWRWAASTNYSLRRLSVTFTNGDETTASLATWASVVPSATMAHPLLLGLDSFRRFTSRSFITLPEPGPDGRTMGELTLSSRSSAGACVYATHEEAPDSSFHLVYAGDKGISLGKQPVLVDVNLVRSSRLPAQLVTTWSPSAPSSDRFCRRTLLFRMDVSKSPCQEKLFWNLAISLALRLLRCFGYLLTPLLLAPLRLMLLHRRRPLRRPLLPLRSTWSMTNLRLVFLLPPNVAAETAAC